MTVTAAFAAAALLGAGPPSPLGAWGGAQIALEVTPQGATLAADCAEGVITAPIRTDADGRFAVTGSFTPHQSGPQLGDVSAPTGAATYRGRVHGDRMELTIIPAAGGETITVSLVRGLKTKIVRCL